MVAKSAPLATFLTGVSRYPLGTDEAEASDKVKSPERSKAEVGRTVILTILGQSQGPIAREDLAARAELRPDWYDQIISGLESEELIEQSDAGLTLTERGRDASERARARLLNPW
jgi:predicted transcriptional regulator